MGYVYTSAYRIVRPMGESEGATKKWTPDDVAQRLGSLENREWLRKAVASFGAKKGFIDTVKLAKAINDGTFPPPK